MRDSERMIDNRIETIASGYADFAEIQPYRSDLISAILFNSLIDLALQHYVRRAVYLHPKQTLSFSAEDLKEPQIFELSCYSVVRFSEKVGKVTSLFMVR